MTARSTRNRCVPDDHAHIVSLMRHDDSNKAMAHLAMLCNLLGDYVEDNLRMSTTLMLQVLEHSPQRGSAKLLLLAIASFAQDDGTGATPSVATLARLIGTKERNVQYLLRDLERAGELTCEYHAGPDGCNRYTVIVLPMDDAGHCPTGVQQSAPSVHSFAPPAQLTASPEDATDCTQLREGENDGEGEHAHRGIDHEATPLTTPPGESPLPSDPLHLWHTGRAAVRPLDEAQLQTLASELDAPTGGYGAYWLGRAILAANACDPGFGTNPRSLNLVRAILRRWKHEHSYGSDTRAYQSKLEHHHGSARSSQQRLATPVGRHSYQSYKRTARVDGVSTPRAVAITACTIVVYDPEADG